MRDNERNMTPAGFAGWPESGNRNDYIRATRRSLGGFHKLLGTELGAGPISHELKDHFFSVTTMMPPAPIELKDIYRSLQSNLANPWENGDERDTRFNGTLKAFAVAAGLLYQTSLPAEKRGFYLYAPDKMWRRAIPELVNFAQKAFPANAESIEARAALIREVQTYMRFIDAYAKSNAKTPDGTMDQAIHVNTLWERLNSDGVVLHFADPEVNRKMDGIQSAALVTIGANPYSTELLLNHRFDSLHAEIRGETLYQSMRREIHQADGSDRQVVEKLRDFYFEDSLLRQFFWMRVYTDMKYHQDVTDWFFTQPEEVAKAFTDAAMKDVTSFSNMEKEERFVQIRKLLSLVADFHGRHPGHENLGVIQRSVDQTAHTLQVGHVVKPVMNILKGDATGIVIREEDGEATARILPQRANWEKFETERREGNGDKIVYVSSRLLEEATEAPPKPREKKDTGKDIDEFAATTELLVEKELTIEGGEFAKDSRWPDAQRVPQSVPRILDHLQGQLEAASIDEGALLDQVLESRNIVKRRKANLVPALFPSLLPEVHILHSLHKLGIISVESKGDHSTIVINAAQADISTGVGDSRILLEGRLDDGNNLIFEGAPKTFEDTALHFLLSEAVLTTMKPRRTESFKGKDHDRVTSRVDAYNNSTDINIFPRIKPPSKDHNDSRINPESTVLIPLGNGFIRAELDWSQVRAA